MLRYLLYVLPVAFALYCVFDVLGSDAQRRRGLRKALWLAVVVLVPVVGGVVWLLVSRQGRADSARPRGGAPVAPDDDPEFLFRLEQEQRRRAREAGGAAPDDARPDGRTGDRQDERSDDPDGAPSA